MVGDRRLPPPRLRYRFRWVNENEAGFVAAE